jgi:hypothetical protein
MLWFRANERLLMQSTPGIKPYKALNPFVLGGVSSEAVQSAALLKRRDAECLHCSLRCAPEQTKCAP